MKFKPQTIVITGAGLDLDRVIGQGEKWEGPK